MIIIKSKLLILVLVFAFAGVLVFGSGKVAAENNNSGLPSLVQMIATKFGLKVGDVQTVFDDYKSQRQSQKQTGYENMLTQAVKDGKITEAQKQLILAKHKELIALRKTNFSDLKNMTLNERKNFMQSQRQALETWAKQNGIDLKYLMPGKLGMWGRGWSK